MPVDLYIAGLSAPSRAVWMTCKAADIPVNIKYIDLMKGEQNNPEFVKMNPHHSVPTMDDNGFYMWESRAMMSYLADKYGKVESLYPKDLQKRAVVERYLYYDMGTVYKTIAEWMYPQLFAGAESNPEKLEKLRGMLDMFDKTHLEGKKFVTGDTVTIADFAIVGSLVFLEVLDFDFSSWKNISAYLQCAKALPYFQECNAGMYQWKESIKAKNLTKSK